MLWLKKNSFLATLIAISVAGLAGFGYLIFKGRGALAEARDAYDSQASELRRLKSGRPFPNDANYRKWKEQVDALEASAVKLRTDTLESQAPLEEISDVRLQKKLTDLVAAYGEQAAQVGVELPTDFNFGMTNYRTELPRREATTLLNFQLDAFDSLFKTLFANGVKAVDGFYRKPLAVEAEPKEEAPTPKAGRGPAPKKPADTQTELRDLYPVEIAFTATQEGAMSILNALANAKDYYFIINFLRVENSATEGPERSEVVEIVEEAPEGAPEGEAVEGEPEGEAVEGEEAPSASGLQFILGRELVKIYLNMDLARFLKPAEAAAAAGVPEETKESS